MKKIVMLLLASIMIFELPALSACKIDKIKECNPPKQKIQDKKLNKIKKTIQTNAVNTQEKYYSASCEFGVCPPKPPKR